MDPPTARYCPMRRGRRFSRGRAFPTSEACGPLVPRVHGSLGCWEPSAGAPSLEVIIGGSRCFSHVAPRNLGKVLPGILRGWRVGPPLPYSPNASGSQSSLGSHRFFLTWPMRVCIFPWGTGRQPGVAFDSGLWGRWAPLGASEYEKVHSVPMRGGGSHV